MTLYRKSQQRRGWLQLGMVDRDDLDELLDDYWTLLQASRLADKSIEDYYYFAMCFVRWSKGEFIPGQNLERPARN
jgi:hypothetical protein